MAFVRRNTRMAVEIKGLQREENWEYPLDALREAIVYAVCHRDYASSANVQVRIFDDRLEVWNPGGLPEGMTVNDLRGLHESKPRNRLVANAFFLIKYVEQFGTGTGRIIADCLDHGLPEPEFESRPDRFRAIFQPRVITESTKTDVELNDRQRSALAYIQKHGHITHSRYEAELGVPMRTANRELKDLVVKRVVLRHGAGRSFRYVLAGAGGKQWQASGERQEGSFLRDGAGGCPGVAGSPPRHDTEGSLAGRNRSRGVPGSHSQAADRTPGSRRAARYPERNDRGSGPWGTMEIEYDATYDIKGRKYPFYIRVFSPLQYTRLSLDDFISKRPCFTDDEWIDLLVQSIGFHPVRFDRRTKMLMLLRLVPFVESNYNLIELGPRETGKTCTFRTRFDEAESSISVLKDYMQTDKFSRGDQEFFRNAETGHRPTGRHETRGVPGCGFPFLGDRVPVGGTVTRCSGLTLGIGAR